MPGNDERDPLDEWLDREMIPLPPPAGTFELISRRARRRKLRKLAITVSSAAAIAIGVGIALPTVGPLHLSQPSTTGAPAANSRSQRPPGPSTPAPAPSTTVPAAHSASATPTVTPSTAPASSGSQPASGTTYPAGGPVPANFQPESVTFIGARTGWAMGLAGTPGHCDNPDPVICMSMAITRDGGQTWRGVPAPDSNAVADVRFLNGKDGWAFGSELWSTHDYGNHWTQVPDGNRGVVALETAGDEAYALFSSCVVPGTANCEPQYTLERTSASSDNWAPVPGQAGSFTDSGDGTPSIVLSATQGWLVLSNGIVESGPLDGPWQGAGNAPCDSAAMNATKATWDSSANLLIVACTYQSGTAGMASLSRQDIYVSADRGRNWQHYSTQASGSLDSVASSPSASVILATSTGLYSFSLGNARGQQLVAMASGFSYVGMTSATQGVAIPAVTGLHQVWLTHDGGLSWAPVTLSS
jgi:hypothetical protein